MDDQHIKLGDVIVFSVELLRQMADEPNPVRVRVKDIWLHDDGSKVLVLDRAETLVGCDCDQHGHPDRARHAHDCLALR